MMRCRVCGQDGLSLLFTSCGEDEQRSVWLRCFACGCDSSTTDYAVLNYDSSYSGHLVSALGGLEACVEAMRGNLDWFDDYKDTVKGRAFLDIGCLEGSGLRGMAQRGWSVHGFDVCPAAKTWSPPGDHVTVAPALSASLFPQRYDAVMAREVLEHVPDWRGFLAECHALTARDGLFQLQTPRPGECPAPEPYQRWHLQLFTPFVLCSWLERLGFTVIETRLWPLGQVHLCRRTN